MSEGKGSANWQRMFMKGLENLEKYAKNEKNLKFLWSCTQLNVILKIFKTNMVSPKTQKLAEKLGSEDPASIQKM